MLQLTTKTVEETEQIGEQLGKLAGPGWWSFLPVS